MSELNGSPGPIKSVVKYLIEIKKLKEEIQKKQAKSDSSECDTFYRGEANKGWTSTPSLFRDAKLYSKEYELYSEAYRKNRSFFADCKTDFQKLSLLQHYGLPTRLMDFTNNPLIALFFACESAKCSDKEICLECNGNCEVNGKILLYNTKVVDDDDNDVKNICEQAFKKDTEINDAVSMDIFVQSVPTSSRMTNQDGMFLLVGHKDEPRIFKLHDKKGRGQKYSGFCKTFEVDSGSKKSILGELNDLGVNEAFVYPELEHRLIYLKNHYLHDKE